MRPCDHFWPRAYDLRSKLPNRIFGDDGGIAKQVPFEAELRIRRRLVRGLTTTLVVDGESYAFVVSIT